MYLAGRLDRVRGGAGGAETERYRRLKAQVNALQKQIQQLEAQQATQAAAPAPAAVPAASASTTPPLSPEDVESMKQSIAQLQLKVDSLDTTVNEGGLAGLSITGYMDPVYMYNNNDHAGSFSFVNHNGAYNYDGSTFGDVYLDIKKTFGSGSLAPSAEISIMPNRGNGATLLATDDGSNSFMNIINTAVATIPLDTSSSFVVGLMSSFGGYEYQLSTLMPTLTHNLLYDFSDPGSYTGVGYNYSTGNFAWKFMLANEQYRTKAPAPRPTPMPIPARPCSIATARRPLPRVWITPGRRRLIWAGPPTSAARLWPPAARVRAVMVTSAPAARRIANICLLKPI